MAEPTCFGTLGEAMKIDKLTTAQRIISARRNMVGRIDPRDYQRKSTAEGGCGVIGIASSVPIEGRHLLQSLLQMRNRGNGKGGGAAIAGLNPDQFGVAPNVIQEDYLIAVAYLDQAARQSVEKRFIASKFDIDKVYEFPIREEIEPAAPQVVTYFARPTAGGLSSFSNENNLEGLSEEELADEYVYRNSYSLNSEYYSATGETRAFVLSHGKDLLVLKLVGYGDDVFRVYGLEDMLAHVWIGHHRYPTKGRVWHPGGAHPFIGLHEALVHNGDFANYASVCSYLAQHNIRPMFLTDTEVSVLVFDLHHRTFGYPLEYVIETLAPTTERDFAMLPESKREVYHALQIAHMHGSPDGPWFFLMAQSVSGGAGPREVRLIGITDTSMLRPQVFALQQGEPGQPSIGFAASEKQAIDAALHSLSESDRRFWKRPDLVWNARGGSHTDGGAFVFNVVRGLDGEAELQCRDKFGKKIEIDGESEPYRGGRFRINGHSSGLSSGALDEFSSATELISKATYDGLQEYLGSILRSKVLERSAQLKLLSLLLDRRYPVGGLRRSSVLALLDEAVATWAAEIRSDSNGEFVHHTHRDPLPAQDAGRNSIVLDATNYPAQGPGSLALELNSLIDRGFRRIVVVNTRGQRFLASGLGGQTQGVRLDVFGAAGDYLASGIDGAEVVVHGSAQDQLAQIMKNGRLIVYGDVGQTFMYGAKGGEAYVMGNAAGRPLINAVGKPRVVINGTCLDYLAESFMAGDPLDGGGFVVLNGISFDSDARLVDLDTPYPGGNLFSLASGGAIFLRDPKRVVGADQLNGGKFADFSDEHWKLVLPYLEENERLFGISVNRLLQHGDRTATPQEIYRVIIPSGHAALQPEQAWVRH